jgi:transposase InsO family protein
MKLSEEYLTSAVCQILDYPRSSFYYRPKVRDESQLEKAILDTAAAWPVYGYRRITAQLQREEWIVNHKRVYRIMREMGLQSQKQHKKRFTTNSQHHFRRFPNLVKDLTIQRPDQVWVSDITYIRLKRGFVYLAVIMDVFTRSIRGWHLSRNLDRELTLSALQKALAKGRPEIHHSDQGLQYAAWEYVTKLQVAQVMISMTDLGAAWQNGYAERLIRTIKEEEVDLTEYQDYWEAYYQIGSFLEEVYMRKRIHSALEYMTPFEFEAKWFVQRIEALGFS